MQLLPAAAPFEFATIDHIGKLITKKSGKRFLLVITDRFSKIDKECALKSITEHDLACAFITHWVLTYGTPRWLLSDNGRLFRSRCLRHVCPILETQNLFTTTTYHSQCNGQIERSIGTIFPGLRHYIYDYPKDWELSTENVL